MGRQGILRMAAWLCAAGLASWLAVSCQKVELPQEEEEEQEQADPGKEEDEGRPDGGEETDEGGEGEGTWVSAFSVAGLQAYFADVEKDDLFPCAVVGYIVGYTSGNTMGNAVFGTDNAGETNILIADDRNETNPERCVPVKLDADTEFRDELNLKMNPGIWGWRIYIEGYASRYFSVVGIKDVAGYEWVEEEPEPPEPDVPDKPDEEPDTPDDHPDEPDVPDETPDEEQPDEEPDQPDVPDTPDENPDEEQPEEVKDTLAIDPKPEIVPGGRSV